MYVTIASYKGGVGKTTTAIHLATYFNQLAPTLLVDGDLIRTSSKWGQRSDGQGLPFKVVPVGQVARHAGQFQHFIFDTEGNPTDEDFKDAAEGADLIVIPAEPEAASNDGLVYTLAKLKNLGVLHYRVLLNKVESNRPEEAEQLRTMLQGHQIPVFEAQIPYLSALKKASARGVPVSAVKDDPRAKRAWEAYEAVGREIMNVMEAAHA